MIIKIPKEFDSKFRFIVVAAERAKQIQNGAPPRIGMQTGKPAHLAIREVQENRVSWEILMEEREEREEEEKE